MSALDEITQAIQMDFLKSAGFLKSPQLPEFLYHYTTADGLHGILQNQELWSTNVLYMNDAAELTDAVSVAKDILDTERKGHEESLELWAVLSLLETHLEQLPLDYFVTCFCQDDDLLSQWRAYGPQGGYCLGFRGSDLATSAGTFECRLVKVIYDRAEKEERIRRRIEIVLRHLKRAVGMPGQNLKALNPLASCIAGLFAGILCEMKNQAFKPEEEWRLICLQPSLHSVPAGHTTKPLHFRISNGAVVPYVKLAWLAENGKPTLPIAKIRCGPGPHPGLAQQAVRDLLRCKGFLDLPVEGSNVPLRT